MIDSASPLRKAAQIAFIRLRQEVIFEPNPHAEMKFYANLLQRSVEIWIIRNIVKCRTGCLLLIFRSLLSRDAKESSVIKIVMNEDY